MIVCTYGVQFLPQYLLVSIIITTLDQPVPQRETLPCPALPLTANPCRRLRGYLSYLQYPAHHQPPFRFWAFRPTAAAIVVTTTLFCAVAPPDLMVRSKSQ